jgi:hypothetical protein
MLRYASSFVIAAYFTVRLIQDSRALPANFLQSRPDFYFYISIKN